MARITSDRDKKVWVHYQAAQKVAGLLAKAGFDAYLIGGAVRDIWLGRLPKDFDIVTNANPDQILELPGLKKAHYQDPAQSFGVSRLQVEVKVRNQIHLGDVEVATYRRDVEAHLGRKQTKVEFAELEDDLNRRDFTINALALDLANDFVVDLTEGIPDLEAKVVKFIGEPAQRIQEDPLRILRGVRLKVQLGFEFATETRTGIVEAVEKGQAQTIAVERTRDELTRMLVHSTRQLAMSELDNLGLIKQLLPELSQTHQVAQPPDFHAEGDVWRHTLLAIENLPKKITSRLAWATLLHDIGKPPTFKPASVTGDRIRFSEHYRVGAEIATKLLGRLKFPKQFIRDVSWMIENHMGVDNLPTMRPKRAEHFMSQPAFADLLELHQADAQASWHLGQGGKVEIPHPGFKTLHQMWDTYQAQQHTHPPSLKDIGVDGNWLQQEFQIEGSKLGEVLAKLEEAYLDHQVTDFTSAKLFVKNLLAD